LDLYYLIVAQNEEGQLYREPIFKVIKAHTYWRFLVSWFIPQFGA